MCVFDGKSDGKGPMSITDKPFNHAGLDGLLMMKWDQKAATLPMACIRRPKYSASYGGKFLRPGIQSKLLNGCAQRPTLVMTRSEADAGILSLGGRGTSLAKRCFLERRRPLAGLVPRPPREPPFLDGALYPIDFQIFIFGAD
jgi:hypothetical protein